MKKGRIIKLVAGVYTVQDDLKNKYNLKPLGVFRHRNITPKVGDIVDFDEDNILKIVRLIHGLSWLKLRTLNIHGLVMTCFY